jgi:uncharacterized membrane protein
MDLHDFKGFYTRYGGKIWLIGILGVIIVLVVGSLVLPDLFWDRFLYRYFWGPVEIDAMEMEPVVQSDGFVIDQGYTLISEVTYGIILITALYGIFRLFERLDIKINVKFILSVAPFFFLGGTLRVLEDAELYNEPYVYFIISPFIYFLIGIVILVAVIYSEVLGRKENLSKNRLVAFSSLPLIIFNTIYILLYAFSQDSFSFMVHPFVPLIISAGMILFLNYHTKKREFDPYLSVFLFGLFLLAFSVFIIMLWPEIEPWKEAYLNAQGRSSVTTQPLGGLWVILITVSITFCIYMAGRLLKAKYPVMKIYVNPVNVFIIFGQMFDAAATFVGVDLYGYSEKHPIPDFFFQTFGTSAVFLPIKLALGVVIVYLIDISFSEDLKNYPNLKGLIKIIIIVLGLGPGTRDVLRLVMGV